MEGYTNFTKLYAEAIASKSFTGSIIGANNLSKADNYSLSAAEKAKVFTGIEMTAGSKTLTLGLAVNQIMIVSNVGATNALTVKNIATDTGTTLAASKAILIVGSATKDASIIIALN